MVSIYAEYGFHHIAEAVEEAQQQIIDFRTGRVKPILTFSQKINEDVLILPGDQIVVGGRPGVGKSSFALMLIRSFLDNNTTPMIVLFWSLEMRSWRQVLRMYTQDFQLTVKEILQTDAPIDQLQALSELLSQYPIHFRTMPPDVNTWAKIVAAIAQDTLVVNVFDHTRLVRQSNERSEEAKITSLMEAGMMLKNNYKCINIFLSQLNRNAEVGNRTRIEIGKTPPVMSDFFGADSVAQFADHAMILHRPEAYNIKSYLEHDTENLMAVHVLKQRDGWTGAIMLEHDLKYNTFKDR